MSMGEDEVMEVGFRTRVLDDEGGFTLEARFVDVDPNSTAGQLGLRISRRITDILALERQGQRFGVWAFNLQSGKYTGRKFAITEAGSVFNMQSGKYTGRKVATTDKDSARAAALTPVSVLMGGAKGPLEIEVFGQLIDVYAPPFLTPPGTTEERARLREKEMEEIRKRKSGDSVDLRRTSSRGGDGGGEKVTPPPDPRGSPPGSPDFLPLPEPDGDDLMDVLFGKRSKLGCEMCKTKMGVLSCKQRKNVAYCGVSCYLASQKKD